MAEVPRPPEEFVSSCPACGYPIDYCQGHGEVGDPVGFAVLTAHDDGNHEDCDPEGCDEALAAGRAKVIQEIAAEIKAGDAPIYTRNDLIRYHKWLQEHTDTFDITWIELTLEGNQEGHPWCGVAHADQDILKFDDEAIEEFVRDFVKTLGGE